jgi:arylsulfatase A-like enzyme
MGVTVTPLLDAAAGFGRGFDDYDCLGFVDRTSVRVALDPRIEQLRASDTPYFLWIHVIDPRMPYTPTDPQFTSWWPNTRARHPSLDYALSGVGLGAILIRDQIPVPEGVEYAMTAWDSEIRAADDFLEEMLAELDDGHLAVVVTSDHGEELNDHHRIGHGWTLYEEVVHIPLVIALPDQQPSVATPLVSLLDVMPTLLEIADAPIPDGLAGRSLVPAMRSQAFPATRDVVMETGGGAIVRAIFDGRYKYAERLEPSLIEALFDLESDPYEEHTILDAHPEIADPLRARLHAALEAAAARRPQVHGVQLPILGVPRHQLQVLGYAN